MRIREFINRLKSDKYYLEKKFRKTVGYELNLKNPATFNEKLQWLKLYDRNPEYTKMVDKYEVKKYVAEKIGEKYVIPTIGIWDNYEDIDFDKLPNQFVLKCTHDSGGVVICKNKATFDHDMVKHKIKKNLCRNFFWDGREYPYKNVKPRIIAEKYIEDTNTKELNDYKVMCFNGVAKLIQVHMGRFGHQHTQDFYSIDWDKLPIVQGIPNSNVTIPRPAFLKELVCLSQFLSKDISHVRVDWYFVQGRLLFGELTLYDGSGFIKFESIEDDYLLGSYLKLPL